MSEAIDNAVVVLYAVTVRYKESANVRCCQMPPDTSNHIIRKCYQSRTRGVLAVLCGLAWSLQCRLEANYA
jgi:hypothetical protein